MVEVRGGGAGRKGRADPELSSGGQGLGDERASGMGGAWGSLVWVLGVRAGGSIGLRERYRRGFPVFPLTCAAVQPMNTGTPHSLRPGEEIGTSNRRRRYGAFADGCLQDACSALVLVRHGCGGCCGGRVSRRGRAGDGRRGASCSPGGTAAIPAGARCGWTHQSRGG